MHERQTVNQGGEDSIVGDCDLQELYETMWSIVMEKRYQSVQVFLCCLHEIKTAQGRLLRESEKRWKRKILADGPLVGNGFDYLLSLWSFMNHNWRQGESNYDKILCCTQKFLIQ